MTPSTLNRDQIAVLAKLAGLNLDESGFEELVEAWGAIEPALTRLRRDRPRADEPAHVYDPRHFLPPPLPD